MKLIEFKQLNQVKCVEKELSRAIKEESKFNQKAHKAESFYSLGRMQESLQLKHKACKEAPLRSFSTQLSQQFAIF